MTLQMLTHSILQKSASVLFLNTEAQMISGVNLQHWIMTLITITGSLLVPEILWHIWLTGQLIPATAHTPTRTMISLYEELKGEMDPEKRKDLIFQMQQILVDDAAVLIDGYYNSSMIYSKKVGSAHIHTADYYWLSTEITPAE